MDEEVIVLISCLCMSSLILVMLGAWYIIYYRKKSKTESTGGSSSSSSSSTPGGGGEWKDAYATYYTSYPACCPKSPNYSSSANKSECDDYSGCEYLGKFAGVSGKLSFEEVKTKNIVSFFDAANQGKGACAKKNKECPWWNQHAKNKKLEIRNPATKKRIVVEALDTCNNADCSSCCTKNAKKGEGTLIDIEEWTAKRFWGGAPRNGKIQWRWV